MTSVVCLLATLLALLTLPVLILLRVTESEQQTTKRLRARGLSYAAIGQRLGFGKTKARRLCLA